MPTDRLAAERGGRIAPGYGSAHANMRVAGHARDQRKSHPCGPCKDVAGRTQQR